MTKEQAKALIKIVELKIEEYAARNSSDGGLIESLAIMDAERDLLELCDEGED